MPEYLSYPYWDGSMSPFIFTPLCKSLSNIWLTNLLFALMSSFIHDFVKILCLRCFYNQLISAFTFIFHFISWQHLPWKMVFSLLVSYIFYFFTFPFPVFQASLKQTSFLLSSSIGPKSKLIKVYHQSTCLCLQSSSC